MRGRPEKFRASIRIRVVTFFFIYLCNLVGYWPICELIEPNIRYLKNHKWVLFTGVFGVKEYHGIVFFKIRGQFNPLLTHQGTLWPFKLHFCPERVKLTSDCEINNSIVFLDPKNISKKCPFMIIVISNFWLYLIFKWGLILHNGQ